jgi:hypothetical protein
MLQRKFCFAFMAMAFHFTGAQIVPSFNVAVADTSLHGYYFLSPTSPGNPLYNYNVILDETGKTIYYKHLSRGSFAIQSNGLISYNQTGKFLLMDSTFSIVDSVFCQNGYDWDGHEFRILPNGHFLFLGRENVQMDLSIYNMFSGNNSPGSSNATVKCAVIQELDENKNVVFEWHAKDYYAFDDADESFLFSPSNVDWTHCNAIEVDTDGNLLLSVRHFNEVTKIDRSTGTIIWRLGGKRNQFTFLNDTLQFIGQHDIRRIANGNITLYDNGKAGPSVHPATAKEYSLNEAGLTATLAWSYVENPVSHSNALGNVQRTATGNTLVNYGMLVNEDIIFNIVTPSGNKLFEITYPGSVQSYRSHYYSSLPWQLNRIQINCIFSGSQYYLDAGSGHNNYLWSTGDTTQLIPVTSTGIFSVFVPYGAEGYLRSEEFIVTNLSDPCNTVSVEENKEENNFSVSPVPASNTLRIEAPALKIERFEICNLFGEPVYEGRASLNLQYLEIDVSKLLPGMYFIKVTGSNKELTAKFIKL